MNSDSKELGAFLDKLSRNLLHAQDSPPAVKIPWPIRILLAIIGGTCIFLAYPTFDLFFLAYIALAFELFAVSGTTPRQSFLLGWLAGSVTNIGGFYWIGSLLENFGHMSTAVSMLLCSALCILQGLVFGLWTWGMQKIRAKSIWISGGAVFLAIEMFFPMLFPWYLGNSQYNFAPAEQTADIFGVLGVSLLIVTVNMLIFDIVQTLWLRHHGAPTMPFDKKGLAVGGLFVAFAAVYAPIRMAQIDEISASSPQLSVGMVEADVGIWENEPPEKLRNNLFLHQTMSQELELLGVDLLVWPESAFQPGYIWGSRQTFDNPTDAEIDALYAPWFQPTARLTFDVLDRAFGEGFHRLPGINKAIDQAIINGAESNGFRTLENFYPALISCFSFKCSEEKPQISRCPFKRIVPDDLKSFLPAAEPLRDSRRADLLSEIRPQDFASPIRGLHVPVIFGSISIAYADKEAEKVSFDELYRMGTNRRKLYNTAYMVNSDGQILGKYHKNYPLLFGEYIPFADQFPWIYSILPEAGNFSAGTEIENMMYKGYAFGPIICYEDILPRFVRKLSALRPNVFVNVTNDAWFGKTSEPRLHLAIAAMRTIEHRKWLIRSTNTGVSAFIDANGRLLKQTSIYEPEIVQQNVAMMPTDSRTIYSWLGDWIGWLAGAWTVFLLILRRRETRRVCQKITDD